MTQPRTTHDHGETCHCVSEHRPSPLELAAHRLLPGEYGGRYVSGNVVWLCPTTHVNVHELLRIFIRRGGLFTWRQALDMYEQPVSRHAFAVARYGWLRIQQSQAV